MAEKKIASIKQDQGDGRVIQIVILGVHCCVGVRRNNHIFLMNMIKRHSVVHCTIFQGFTYVAPSVLESVKEKFSFEPKIRSPRRFIGSPRTPVRYSKFVIRLFFLNPEEQRLKLLPSYINERSVIFALT